jgi:hypothetical protein
MILPEECAYTIWCVSWLSFVSGTFAVFRGYADLSIVPYSVWLTSMNYWRAPDYSWRRYVDIACVQCALWYQVYRAFGAEYQIEYYSITLLGLLFGYLGFLYRNDDWTTTIFHAILHVTANIGNMVLYSGRIA